LPPMEEFDEELDDVWRVINGGLDAENMAKALRLYVGAGGGGQFAVSTAFAETYGVSCLNYCEFPSASHNAAAISLGAIQRDSYPLFAYAIGTPSSGTSFTAT